MNMNGVKYMNNINTQSHFLRRSYEKLTYFRGLESEIHVSTPRCLCPHSCLSPKVVHRKTYILMFLWLLCAPFIARHYTNFTNPIIHLFRIPPCSIQNRNVHISVLNGALWDMEQVYSGICELGHLKCKFLASIWLWLRKCLQLGF